jgi:hypothetical protein
MIAYFFHRSYKLVEKVRDVEKTEKALGIAKQEAKETAKAEIPVPF